MYVRGYTPPPPPTWNKALCKHTVRSYVTGSDWSLYTGVKYAYKECLCRASLCKVEVRKYVQKLYRWVTTYIHNIINFFLVQSSLYLFFTICSVEYMVPKNEKRKNETGTRRDFTVNLEVELYCLSVYSILKMYRQYAFLVTWIYFIGVIDGWCWQTLFS